VAGLGIGPVAVRGIGPVAGLGSGPVPTWRSGPEMSRAAWTCQADRWRWLDGGRSRGPPNSGGGGTGAIGPLAETVGV